MQDYDEARHEAEEKVQYYAKRLEDMEIDELVDKLIVSARAELRSVLNYRPEWPGFSALSLSSVTRWKDGKIKIAPSINYSFRTLKLDQKYYDGLLEIADEIGTEGISKTYKHEEFNETHESPILSISWKVYCSLSSEDESLLRKMGVIRTQPFSPTPMGGYDVMSCDSPSSVFDNSAF